jgi:hypothetical protein
MFRETLKCLKRDYTTSHSIGIFKYHLIRFLNDSLKRFSNNEAMLVREETLKLNKRWGPKIFKLFWNFLKGFISIFEDTLFIVIIVRQILV